MKRTVCIMLAVVVLAGCFMGCFSLGGGEAQAGRSQVVSQPQAQPQQCV